MNDLRLFAVLFPDLKAYRPLHTIQFVIQTEAVQVPEEAEKVPEEKEALSFWEKMIDLFS